METFANTLDSVATHLGFFGYKCTRDDAGIGAQHESKPYLRVFESEDVVMFMCGFAVGPAATEDRNNFLEFVNTMNSKSDIGKFYHERNLLYVESWYSGEYDQSRFAVFFDLFLHDIGVPTVKFPNEVAKYFKTK